MINSMTTTFHYLSVLTEPLMARIKVDLHDVYNNSRAIDQALEQAFEEAISKKIR